MKLRKNTRNHELNRIDKLHDEIRGTACQSVEGLWGTLLDVGGLELISATEKALRLMVRCGSSADAMMVLEAMYALAEIALPENFSDCQQYPALTRLFMEAFLAESEDFIFDTGMDDVLALLMSEDQ